MRSRRKVDDRFRGTRCTRKPVMITNLDKFEPFQSQNRRGNTTPEVTKLHFTKSRMKRTSIMTNTTSTATTLTTASKASTSLSMTYAEETKETLKDKKCYPDLCWEPFFLFVSKRRRGRQGVLIKGDKANFLSRRPDGFLALVVDDNEGIFIGNGDEGEDSRPLSPATYDTPRTARSEDPNCDEATLQHIFNPKATITSDNSTGIVCLMEHHCSKKLSYEESYFCNSDVPSPLSSSECSQAFHKPSAYFSANTTNSNNNRERAYTAPPSFCESLQLEPIETTFTSGQDVDYEEGVVILNNNLIPPSQRILEEASVLFQSALDCEQCNNNSKNDEAACFLLEALSLLRTKSSVVNSEQQIQIQFLQIKILHRLGVVHWKRGYYTDSLKCLTTCLMAQEEFSNHADSDYYLKFLKADTHRAIGSTHLSLGHYNEAEKWLRSSIHYLKEIRAECGYRPNCQQYFHSGSVVIHSVAAGTIALMLSLSALGSVFQEQGLYWRAFKFFRRSLHYHQLHCDLLGTNEAAIYSFHVANTWNKIGSVYEATGQHREAMASFSEALWLYRLSFSHDHVDIAVTYVNIGRLHLIAWNEPQEALEAFHEALRVFKMILGDSHRNTASVYCNLAITHVFLQEYGQAIEYFELCLRIQRGILGDFHLDVASTLYSMAQMYEKLQSFDEALHLYKSALQIQTTILGKMHIFAAITLHQIVGIKFNDSTSSSPSLRKYCTRILHVYHRWGIPSMHRRVKHILSFIQDPRV
jgi:tetratricopeptide (TPR) repeat protein